LSLLLLLTNCKTSDISCIFWIRSFGWRWAKCRLLSLRRYILLLLLLLLLLLRLHVVLIRHCWRRMIRVLLLNWNTLGLRLLLIVRNSIVLTGSFGTQSLLIFLKEMKKILIVIFVLVFLHSHWHRLTLWAIRIVILSLILLLIRLLLLRRRLRRRCWAKMRWRLR